MNADEEPLDAGNTRWTRLVGVYKVKPKQSTIEFCGRRIEYGRVWIHCIGCDVACKNGVIIWNPKEISSEYLLNMMKHPIGQPSIVARRHQ